MPPTPTGHHGPVPYAIRVQGHLDLRWSAWFDGLEITRADDGTTTIHGPVADQAALHGLLRTLRDVGLPVLSLAQVVPEDDASSPDPLTRRPT